MTATASDLIAADVLAEREWAAQLRAIVADCATVAEEHGFTQPTWAIVPAKLAFALTEIREADGAASSDTGDGDAWTVEVLDYVLRTGAVLDRVFPTYFVRATRDGLAAAAATRRARFRDVWQSLRPLVRATCDAIQQWRGGEERRAPHVQAALECGVRDALVLYASATGRGPDDVLADLAAVVDRNRKRPRRHGHAEALA